MKRPAQPAYLDPATGTYVVQMVIAAILAGLYALKDFWASLFGRRAAAGEDEDEEPGEAPEGAEAAPKQEAGPPPDPAA